VSTPSDIRVKALDPVFAEMNAATERHVWEIPELSTREKILLCVVADVCEQTLSLPFELHVTTGLEHGVPIEDIREMIRLISYDSGYPAALAALERLADIERALGLPGSAGESHDVNANGVGSPLPAPVRGRLLAMDAHFTEHMELQSRMRAGITRLSDRERAYASMTVDVLYQTLDESFRIHVRRAVRAGATPAELRAVLRFGAQFGVTRPWRALRVLDTLFAETYAEPVLP
jgi:alkylhydroperoxidase/carboxymuconolactone decarboxylase family protein YurZ